MSAPNFQKLLEVFVSPLQDLENVLFQLLDILGIDDMEGVGLDTLGVLIGCGRQGDLDPRYRIRIKAQIKINASHGTPQEIVDILKTLQPTNAFTVVVGNEAEFQITDTIVLASIALGRQLEVAVEQAKLAGVRGYIQWRSEEIYFGWSEDPDAAHRKGFGVGPFVFPG